MPREVLRHMGELVFFGILYPAESGGSEMDVFGMIVLAEELGRSTFGGVSVTLMVHTAMASPHLVHAGMGYIRETAIERMVRDARLHAIGGGATEVMLEEIAKRWN